VEAAMSIEAMKQALEALERHKPKISEGSLPVLTHDAAITALRAAIERSEQPVAWMYDFMADNEVIRDWMTQDHADITRENGFNVRPLYTAPQYDQTALELCEECGWKAIIPGDGCLVCARQKATPVAYADSRIHGWPDCFVMEPDPPHTVPLYTEPREWVGLTNKDIIEMWPETSTVGWDDIRLIEAKLKELNT
jgi:hypothetical protein